MKILIFMTQFYQLSGAEKLAVELGIELNKRGIPTDILSMYSDDLPGVAEAKQALINKGVPTVHFLNMKIHPSATSLILAILKLKKLLRKHQYNIVETSMVMPTLIASWATLGSRVRLVAGLHRVFKKDRENRLLHRFWCFSIKCNNKIRYYAISDYVRNKWIEYSNTQPHHTSRIYNAIPDGYFDVVSDRDKVRKELQIPNQSCCVLYVGRLAEFKGIFTLFDALRPVCKQYDIYLLYVGLPDLSLNGTVQIIQQIKTQIAKESLRKRIRFLGYRNDVPRIMRSADILAHPTSIEGFGLTLVEALATGLPVVASNVEAIPEVLENTDSKMVEPNNTKELHDAIMGTFNRSSVEASVAKKKGRHRAQFFRLSTRTTAMINLFNNVLQSKL